MTLWQLHEVFGMESAKGMLERVRGNERVDPHKCTACGACVEACPQDLPIPDRMARLAELIDALPEA